MGILHRQSRWERVVKPVVERLDLPKGVKSEIANPPKAVKSGVAAVGGFLGLTAGSAVVSSMRQREGKRT